MTWSRGETLVGASPTQVAEPTAVLRVHASLRSRCTLELPLQIRQPPTTPTPRHRGNLTPYTGCYTCAENKQGASVCGVRVGAAWRPQRRPAAACLVKPALVWEPNHTPPSPRLTPVYPGEFSPLPRHPSIPRSLCLQAALFPSRAGKLPHPHRCPLGRVPWALCVEAWGLGLL